MDDDGTDTNDATDGQGTRIAHKDLGRVGVVPQETDHGSHEGTEENHQFLRVGDVHDVEV